MSMSNTMKQKDGLLSPHKALTVSIFTAQSLLRPLTFVMASPVLLGHVEVIVSLLYLKVM